MERNGQRRDGDESLEPTVRRRSIPPNPRTAEVELVKIVAALEGTNEDELPPLWRDTNRMIANLFEQPPERHSQMELTLTYAGYRITIDRRGEVALVETSSL